METTTGSPMTAQQAQSFQLTAHEDRIQELEDRGAQLRVDLAEFAIEFEHLKTAIDEQFLPSLKQIQMGLAVHREESKVQLVDISSRLGGLELVKKTKLEHRALWKGRLIALAMGLAGTGLGALLTTALKAWMGG